MTDHAAPQPGHNPDPNLPETKALSEKETSHYQQLLHQAMASMEKPGDAIGPYTLRQVLGEGGFGVVWLAERSVPMQQSVALKVIKPGMDSKAVVARFEQERQALAVMDHVNVAKVFDGGVTPTGRPYFVMELVKGEAITNYCDRHRLSIDQRLELFVAVCEAVQHAHSKGIIHRDLKPSNILVSVQGGKAIPKVIDFGVAKAISHTLTEKTIFTERGQLIGTPEYMSPEQAEMGSLDIDTRTDVYSLGVILYELLTGVLPFDPKTLRSAGYAEIQRIIREQDAPRPSTRLSTIDDATGQEIARVRQAQRESLTGVLRRELDWIPMQAMRKDRTRRYATPLEMADDVKRYLSGEALRAAPESRGYLLRKFIARNRWPVAAAALIAGVLMAATAVSSWYYARAEEQRAVATQVTAFLTDDLLKSPDPEVGAIDTKVVDILATGRKKMGESFASNRPVLAQVQQALGEAYLSLGDPTTAKELLEPAIAYYRDIGQAQRADALNASLQEARYRGLEAQGAVDEIKKAITEVEARDGKASELAMDLRNQLGGALKNSGQLDEAETIYTAVLKDRIAAHGAKDVRPLITRHNLNMIGLQRARALRRSGEEEKALAFAANVLAERTQITIDTLNVLGPDDPQTLATQAEELGLKGEFGPRQEALDAYPPLIDRMRARLGATHWRTSETIARCGNAFRRAQRWNDAAEYFLLAMDDFRISKGVTNSQTILLTTLTAECLVKGCARTDRAAQLLDRAEREVKQELSLTTDANAKTSLESLLTTLANKTKELLAPTEESPPAPGTQK